MKASFTMKHFTSSKKISSLLLAPFCCLTIATTAQASTFADVPSSHWAYSHVQVAAEAGLVGGTEEGLFHPEKAMSYGEFAVIIVNGAYNGDYLPKNTDSHWSDIYLNVLLDQSLLLSSGVSVVEMSDGWKSLGIPREDVATVTANLMRKGDFLTGDLSLLYSFTDIDHLSWSQKQDIADCIANGVMIGTSDTSFGTGNSLNRGAASVIIKNMLQLSVLQSLNAVTPEIMPEVVPEIVVPQVENTGSQYNMPADVNGDGVVSESEIKAVFDSFKVRYPQGTPWTNDNSYQTVIYRYDDNGSVSKVNMTGYGCAGWAFMLQDAIYGNAPQYVISRDEVQAGDYWHTGSHWGVVMEVKGNNTFVTTEGNFNSSIYWDYTRTGSYLTDSVIYYSRNPK